MLHKMYKGKEIVISKRPSGNYLLELGNTFLIAEDFDDKTLDKLLTVAKGK